jgi:uncharacterized protein (TIGR02246 family)
MVDDRILRRGGKPMNDDERQIRKLMDEWRRRTLEGDLEGVLALMTGDAVFLTPGNPPMTRSDFADASRGFTGKFQVESTQEIQDLHASGDLAYAWSHIKVVMTSAETGARTERAGHVLSVFRKTPSGWLLARDANLMAASQG